MGCVTVTMPLRTSLQAQSADDNTAPAGTAWPTGATHSARAEAQGSKAAEEQAGGGLNDMLFGSTGPRGGQRDGLLQIAAKTMTRTIGSSIGRQIVRGILGSLLGGRR